MAAAVLLGMVAPLSWAADSAAQTALGTSSATAKLPDPLTLPFALSLDIRDHPQLQRAGAEIEAKQADKALAESYNDFSADLELEARRIEPNPIAYDQDANDSQAHLYIRRQLYDFGRSGAARDAALADLQGSELLYSDAENQRRIAIMARYFDVLLADLAYARDNEAMSTSYVQYDRGRKRNKLGQMSDVKLLELENNFQLLRRAYFNSQAQQRNSRARLANALNRPGQLVSNLEMPELSLPLDSLPDFSELEQRAMDHNPRLQAVRLQVSAAEQRVQEARSGRYPVLKGQVQVSQYARDAGSYDDWRASVILDVPLLAGDSLKAQVVKRNAQLRDTRARLRAAQMRVSQQLLEAWQEVQSLKVAREQVDVQKQYRELYLDRARTLYQMEFQSDLGDAMVKISETRLEKFRVEYALALEWAKIQALTGQTINILQEQNNETAQ